MKWQKKIRGRNKEKNRSYIYKSIVYEVEDLFWNFMKLVKKILFGIQYCVILVNVRGN